MATRMVNIYLNTSSQLDWMSITGSFSNLSDSAIIGPRAPSAESAQVKVGVLNKARGRRGVSTSTTLWIEGSRCISISPAPSRRMRGVRSVMIVKWRNLRALLSPQDSKWITSHPMRRSVHHSSYQPFVCTQVHC